MPPPTIAHHLSGRSGRGAAGIASVPIPDGPTWRRLFAFMGPGYLVAVGYMDPGNWATALAGGSAFGYELLCVILLSNCMAMALQSMAAKLGIVTGLDLAQACRARYSPIVSNILWVLCEIAIIACDLAEVIGTAVALQLLFGLPLAIGVWGAAISVFAVMALERRGIRSLEALIIALMFIVGVCLAIELLLSQPNLRPMLDGFIPRARLVTDPAMLYLAIGIVGATVMPHNLYLHSSIVQSRRHRRDNAGMKEAIRFASIDSTASLAIALIINASILILAASTFHAHGDFRVTELSEAYQLLSPMLGTGFASALFGVALLASGQNATITGSLAGQIVMEGFTNLRMPIWKRRMAARAAAIIPASLIAATYGEVAVSKLLIISQVTLSAQLPFAAIPLFRICNDAGMMGTYVNHRWTKIGVGGSIMLILSLNGKLAFDAIFRM